jgi:cytochrome c
MMKLSTISTLWDYINRAMPWNAPKTLKVDEVYAVSAYILNMAEVLPDDFTLSDQNIAEVQKLLPNRNGMTVAHGMARASGRPDVHNTACMKDCSGAPKVISELPAYARNAHGNNAEQNRLVGPVRGADTLQPAPVGPLNAATVAAATQVGLAHIGVTPAQEGAGNAALDLIKKHGCVACHSASAPLLGPSWDALHKKYQGASAAVAGTLEHKIRQGGGGVWGTLPMPPQGALPAADLQLIVAWLTAAAK